jgi:alkylated DNA repair dioxygenase AlkB
LADLFTSADYSSDSFQDIDLQDGELRLYTNFFSASEADRLLHNLHKEIDWKQEKMSMYGKVHNLPRLMAFYGDTEQEDNNHQYTFSGIKKTAREWTRSLEEVKERIETVSKVRFNSVLANLYRDGNDGVAWHSDDEVELGRTPTIASLSFGQVREFQLKHKTHSHLRHSLLLPHGSFLLMSGPTQQYWSHQIPKRAASMNPRINLTYRIIS